MEIPVYNAHRTLKGDFQMKTTKGLFAFLFLLGGSGCALAQDAKPAEPRSIAQGLERSIAGAASEFVPAAGAMPEAKYSFVPTSGEFQCARSFAQPAKPVAAVTYLAGTA